MKTLSVSPTAAAVPVSTAVAQSAAPMPVARGSAVLAGAAVAAAIGLCGGIALASQLPLSAAPAVAALLLGGLATWLRPARRWLALLAIAIAAGQLGFWRMHSAQTDLGLPRHNCSRSAACSSYAAW